LPSERQATLLPLVQSQVDARAKTKAQDTGLDAHARRLMKIDREKARSFAEFAAFDLSLDAATMATIDGIRTAIGETDAVRVQLECLQQLIRLEPNPEQVQRFAVRATRFVEILDRDDRWQEMAAWLTRQRQLATSFAENRPDVSEVILGSLGDFCTVQRAARLVELAGRDDAGRAAANAVVEALGPALGPALLEAVRRPTSGKDAGARDGGKAAVQLLCDHARLVAPSLVAALDASADDDPLLRAVARVLGLAGAGYEVPLGRLLTSRDEKTVREALRALAKIGSARAAALVGAQVDRSTTWVGKAAEETLWHFPKNESERQVRELLGRRDFVMRHPQAAGRLLDRAAQNGALNLEPILQTLVPLRYRFWNPALVRVARQAKTMLAR
jgi:hypothetical protein